MRIIFTMIILLTLNLIVKGQEAKNLTISVSKGLLTSGYYDHAKAKGFVDLDFDYNLTKTHILSANYFIGQHYYFEKDGTDAINYAGGCNAKVHYNTFSILYKNMVFNRSNFNAFTGLGAGVMTKTLEYPFEWEGKTLRSTLSKSYFVVPVSLNLNYKIYRNWFVGIKGGFLIEPGISMFSALHAGPKLSFLFL